MNRLIGTAIRAWNKLIRDRRRYGTSEGYDAESYWHDRLGRKEGSLTRPGHEGRTEAENVRDYEAARAMLEDIFDDLKCCGPGTRVVEVGPGTGFWTEFCAMRGVTDLLAIDITDVQFDELKRRFPAFRFIKGDASQGLPAKDAELVLILDVIEHVVHQADLGRLLSHALDALQPGGVLVLSFPPPSRRRRNLFYLRFWPVELVIGFLAPAAVVLQVPFRDGVLLVARMPA